MQLQAARQRRNEGPQEFADRCRALAQKLVFKVHDPQAQRIHQENAERMFLAAFISGLVGTFFESSNLPAGAIYSPYGGVG